MPLNICYSVRMSLKDQFVTCIHQNFPALGPSLTQLLVSENLTSPFVVDLPQKVLTQAQDFISAIWSVRESSEYQKSLCHPNVKDPGNKAICMSYDFHLSSDENLKLIEINTNASFLALGSLLYQTQKLPPPISGFHLDDLKESILTELKLFGKSVSCPKVAIIDDHPKDQKLYIEFLVFQELIRSWGWICDILDYRELDSSYDFVYNRYTDFYFSDPSSSHLKQMFLEKKTCFSPNPFEYFLLADKQRMIQWAGLHNEVINRHLPVSVEVRPEQAEDLWTKRKKFFFKPKASFGSKQTYRGEKITRKVFDSILTQDFIAQEFIPAPEKNFPGPQGSIRFKYDLRFYTYQNQIQSVVARLYQGQVTNLQSPLGGFACVNFI